MPARLLRSRVSQLAADSCFSAAARDSISNPWRSRPCLCPAARHLLQSQQETALGKGETSANALDVEKLYTDCDRDTVLIAAWPRGPVCHSGTGSRFRDAIAEAQSAMSFLGNLKHVIDQRLDVRLPGSYTARLLDAGGQRIARKVGGEGIEVALAASGGSDHEVVSEVADLLYHVLVTLKARGLSLEQVLKELEASHVAQQAVGFENQAEE